MLPSISVITCSHNPEMDYVNATLQALRRQTLPIDNWEYILVDNRSVEKLADKLDLSWHSKARHIREDNLGLTKARLRGINEARGELLVFVDDDNVLDDDFLERVWEIGKDFSYLGAWGGRCVPRFESLPEDWTRRYWGSLAIRDVHRDQWSNLASIAETMPCGAGLCVRRDVARFYLNLHENGKRAWVLDRVGKSLVSGGDVDLASCACDLGMGVGVFKRLRLVHLMPAYRLKEDYLLNLVESIAFSGVLLDSYRSPEAKKTGTNWKSIVADGLRCFAMTPRERRFSAAFKRGKKRGWEVAANHAA